MAVGRAAHLRKSVFPLHDDREKHLKALPRRGRNKKAQGKAQRAEASMAAALGSVPEPADALKGPHKTYRRGAPSSADRGCFAPSGLFYVITPVPRAATTLAALALSCPGLPCCGPYGAFAQASASLRQDLFRYLAAENPSRRCPAGLELNSGNVTWGRPCGASDRPRGVVEHGERWLIADHVWVCKSLHSFARRLSTSNWSRRRKKCRTALSVRDS